MTPVRHLVGCGCPWCAARTVCALGPEVLDEIEALVKASGPSPSLGLLEIIRQARLYQDIMEHRAPAQIAAEKVK